MKSRLLLFVLLLFAGIGGGASAQGNVPALPGYTFVFPRDNFNHPAYATEWWYYTGNLRAPDGHRFGFELTFFRQGVSHQPDPSPWYVHDLYMAHLALSDVSGGRYYQAERLNRAGPGIAGIDADRRLVWNGNWHTAIGDDAHTLKGIGDNFSFALRAVPRKPPVINGVNGVSQKAQGAGHASHYISFPRMAANGTVTLEGKTYTVDGDAWMDHEFFSETAGGGEVGWDWLSLQLDNGSELMLYRLRHSDGSVDPYSSGTFVDSHGQAHHLALHDFTMSPSGATWRSNRTAAAYPIGWNVTVPALDLQLGISTPMKDQEFVSRFGPSYWEGAIDIAGSAGGHPVHGSGYLEMTGYSAGKSSPFPASPR